MKKLIAITIVGCAMLLSAQDVNVQMPFHKGKIVPIAGWKGSDKNVVLKEIDGKTMAYIAPTQELELIRHIPCKEGDTLSFEITMKQEKGDLSIRARKWSKEGYAGEDFMFLKDVKKDLSTYKGQIVVTNDKTPDKNGVLRKTNRVLFVLHAHGSSKDILIQDVKLTVIPKK